MMRMSTDVAGVPFDTEWIFFAPTMTISRKVENSQLLERKALRGNFLSLCEYRVVIVCGGSNGYAILGDLRTMFWVALGDL